MRPPPVFDDAFRDDLTALLTWRRDARRFRSKPVAEAAVADLLELAQRAPSVGNSQPWRFVRVRTPALRAALADHADAEAARAGARYDADRRAAYAALKLHGLREAGEVIAVFSDEGATAGHGLGAATMPEARVYSTVLAIHTLWLAARARDLALGWVSIVRAEVVARLLSAPPGWRFVALLCLGHPEEQADTSELARAGWQARIDWRRNVSQA